VVFLGLVGVRDGAAAVSSLHPSVLCAAHQLRSDPDVFANVFYDALL